MAECVGRPLWIWHMKHYMAHVLVAGRGAGAQLERGYGGGTGRGVPCDRASCSVMAERLNGPSSLWMGLLRRIGVDQ